MAIFNSYVSHYQTPDTGIYWEILGTTGYLDLSGAGNCHCSGHDFTSFIEGVSKARDLYTYIFANYKCWLIVVNSVICLFKLSPFFG